MFLIPHVLQCLLSSFPFVQRTSISHSFRIDLLATDFLSCLSSETVFISSAFLKNIFAGYRILRWQFFSFSTWRFCATSFWTSRILMRNLLSFRLQFPYRWRAISHHLLSWSFSLYLVFRRLIMMFLGVDFFSFLMMCNSP